MRKNRLITDEKSVAKHFNDYFISIIKPSKYKGKNLIPNT